MFCRMSCVCRSWKKAISDDKVSDERRLRYLELHAMNKVVYHTLHGSALCNRMSVLISLLNSVNSLSLCSM